MKPSDQEDDLLYIIFLTPLNYSGQPPAFPLTILHIATYLNPCDLSFMLFDLHQILFCKARPPFFMQEINKKFSTSSCRRPKFINTTHFWYDAYLMSKVLRLFLF